MQNLKPAEVPEELSDLSLDVASKMRKTHQDLADKIMRSSCFVGGKNFALKRTQVGSSWAQSTQLNSLQKSQKEAPRSDFDNASARISAL